MALSEDLNLDLAWRKTKRNLERNEKIFVNNPYIYEIIDNHQDEFLDILSEDIDGEDGYSPSASRIINIPKDNWNIRPGSILKISDLTIYSAIAIELYDDIQSEIEWSAKEQRFSRILLDNIENSKWMESSYTAWRDWKDKTKDLFDEYEYIVVSDVASYFENIEHQILYSDVERINDNKELRDLLYDCLQRWQHPKNRGLPQGYYPSNILSELYFNKIDRKLAAYDIHHTRYSDDMNIYCKSKQEAIESLKKLSELYQKKGLYIQREKTKILTSEEAKKEFRDPQEKIDIIEEQLQPEQDGETGQKYEPTDRNGNGSSSDGNVGSSSGGSDDQEDEDDRGIPYTDGGEIIDLDFDYNGNTENDAVFEAAFDKYIKENDSPDSGVLRYILRHLAEIDSDHAVSYCIEEIKEGKPNLRMIIKVYFDELDNRKRIANRLLRSAVTNELHYPFQKFVIVRWIFESKIESESILSNMRILLNTSHEIPETDNYIMAYLGEHGDATDIELVSEEYPNAVNHIQKSVILASVRNMEKDLKGPLYNQAEHDHYYCNFSVEFANMLPS